jgi:four helix bundle protein
MANMRRAPIVSRGVNLRRRTLAPALAAIRLHRAICRMPDARILSLQLVRAATSTGANYRAACRARSRREFIARLGVVIEECDETLYWLELIRAAGVIAADGVTEMEDEAEELLRVFVASVATAKARSRG